MFTSSDFYTLIMAIMTAVSTVATITWFMSNQFSKVRHMIYERIQRSEENLLEKIEYHERHDDQRFSDLRNDLWTVKLAVAANTAAREKRLALMAAQKDYYRNKHIEEENGA